MGGQLPVPVTRATLIVLCAFDRDDEGNLRAAFEPREMPDAARAVRMAKLIAGRHDGVIAWSRPARPDIGEFGEPTELWRAGEIPDLE